MDRAVGSQRQAVHVSRTDRRGRRSAHARARMLPGNKAEKLIQKIVFELGGKKRFFEKSGKGHEYWVELGKGGRFLENNKSVSILL